MKNLLAMAAMAAMAAMTVCSLSNAADWQPLPGAPTGKFYDAGNVIWEGKGRVQVVQREVLTEAGAQNAFVGHPLHEGSVAETTHLLNCKERRAYQRFVQFYDERGIKVAYTDSRTDLPFDDVDKGRFSDKPHVIQTLFNHLCKAGKK